jgi:hypothetical protein
MTPPEPCAAPATLMGSASPTATSVRRSTNPGFHTRFVPPSGFLTLLTVCSLRHFPVSRTGATRGVHPSRAFPLRRALHLKGLLTLMSFLTSRAPALRTRRSRCPATPGLYSLRRSVPDSSRCARGPILSWDSVLFGSSTFCCECQWPGTRPETPDGVRSPKAPRPGEQGRDNRSMFGFHRSDQQPKSVHQDLSPGSPDDSDVLSDCSDFK